MVRQLAASRAARRGSAGGTVLSGGHGELGSVCQVRGRKEGAGVFSFHLLFWYSCLFYVVARVSYQPVRKFDGIVSLVSPFFLLLALFSFFGHQVAGVFFRSNVYRL